MATFEITAESIELVRLVQAAQSGDREAFGELFIRFQARVFAIALRTLGNHGDAMELTQDVFLKAMTKLDQLRSPECFPGWLRSIARRMAINRISRNPAARTVEQESLDAQCIERRTPLSYVLDRERADEVRSGLDRLGALDRETLDAFYLRGQSLRDLSSEFDAPIGTIKRRLHTARKRLSAQLA
jgi:RNA polymerase sigma-70 factor (ECF subfamily)